MIFKKDSELPELNLQESGSFKDWTENYVGSAPNVSKGTTTTGCKRTRSPAVAWVRSQCLRKDGEMTKATLSLGEYTTPAAALARKSLWNSSQRAELPQPVTGDKLFSFTSRSLFTLQGPIADGPNCEQPQLGQYTANVSMAIYD